MSDFQKLKSSLYELLGDETEIYSVTSKKVDLIAISQVFQGMGTTEQRENFVRDGLKARGVEMQIGLMSLYTPEEAEALGVEIQEEQDTGQPRTWLQLMKWSNMERKIERESAIPKVVAFYSFKGGVGRTTAMIHVAWALANKGKKVVMVDLDFEAPSLHQAVGSMRVQPTHGLVDYLYERMNLLKGEKPRITVSDIIGEVEVKKGRLFAVPAGKVNVDYISKVDDLRNLPFYDVQTWESFKEEVVDQVEPDFILIDSRTGINIWGALSLLTIADDSIVFFNPNPQNREGVTTILTALKKVGISPVVVLSPVIHMNGVGGEVARAEWRMIKEAVDGEDLNDVFGKEDLFLHKQDQPIMIPFETEIALAEKYPHVPSVFYYQDIVEILDDKLDRPKLIQALHGVDRKRVLNSFAFIPWNAENQSHLIRELFQKPTGFERFVDPSTAIIRGRKGTGKTTLFRVATKEFEWLRQYAPYALKNVHPVVGYDGQDRIDFNEVRNVLQQNQLTWKHFWQVYALVQLATQISVGLPISNLWSGLKQEGEATLPVDIVIQILKQDEIAVRIEEALLEQKHNGIKGSVYWLMYDNIEGHIMQLPYGQEIVEGLLQFVKFLEKSNSRLIGIKVFLQNNRWDRLEESVKKGFVGRDMELKWAREDMQRLVVRQLLQSEEFAKLAYQYASISNVDSATDDMIEDTLELLLGIQMGANQERTATEWLFAMLTDGTQTMYPELFGHVLRAALEFEKTRSKPAKDSEDRLIRLSALSFGLEVGSEERWSSLRAEYKCLTELGFFDYVLASGLVFEQDSLWKWWDEKASEAYLTFESFMREITQTGIFWCFSEEQKLMLFQFFKYSEGASFTSLLEELGY